MDTIQDMINFLLVFIPTAGTMRLVALKCEDITRTEDERTNGKMIRNLLVFCVLAELIAGVLKLVASYFGTSF